MGHRTEQEMARIIREVRRQEEKIATERKISGETDLIKAPTPRS